MDKDYVITVTMSDDGGVTDKFRFAAQDRIYMNIAYIASHNPDKRITFDCSYKKDFIRYVYDEGALSEYVLGKNFLSTSKGFGVTNPLSDIQEKIKQYQNNTLWAEGPQRLDDYLSEKKDYSRTLRLENRDDVMRVDLSYNRLPLPPDIRLLYEYSGLNADNANFSTVDMMHQLPDWVRPAALKIEERPATEMPNPDLCTIYDVSFVIDNTLVSCSYQYLTEYIEAYGRPTDAEFAAGLLDDYFINRVELWKNRCAPVKNTPKHSSARKPAAEKVQSDNSRNDNGEEEDENNDVHDL